MPPVTLLPERYSLENLRKVVRNPRLLRRELFTLSLGANERTRSLTTWGVDDSSDGFDVMAADWDNLLVLDACRFDLFEDRVDIDGTLRRVRSKGSDSWEFMAENFVGRTLHDTVYVTANPHVYQLDDDVFHAVVDLLDTRWDEDTATVRPEAVREEALAAHERFPNKRLLVHFMQPHFPFLGPTGQSFEHAGLEMHLDDGERTGAPNPWYALIHDADVDVDTVYTAYRENLDIALPHVEKLLDALPGKSVVTADHGNLVGERGRPIPIKLFGHPRGVTHEGVLAVPWLEVDGDERRSIRADPPVGVESAADEAVVDQRLKALGYA